MKQIDSIIHGFVLGVVAYSMSCNKFATSEANMFWDEPTSTAITGQIPRFLDVLILDRL